MTSDRKFFTPYRLACTGILLLAAVIYFPCMCGTFIWDDKNIMSGAAIGGGKSLLSCFTSVFLESYYRPLMSASFVLEKPLSRHTPFFYHQTNILLHVLTTGFLIGLLRAAFRRRSVALLGGLLFAVQPVQVSAVAWIGGRTDALCALFMVLFGWLLVLAAQSAGSRSYRFLSGAVLAYLLAILTKEQAIPAILLAPLAFRCWSPDGVKRSWRAIWLSAAPVFAALVLFLTLYVAFGPPPPEPVRDRSGAILEQVLRTACYYALLLFAPTAKWMHSMSLGAFVHAGIWPLLGGAILLVVLPVLFLRWLRTEPAAAWFLALSVLTLAMVSNIFPVPSMLICPYRAGVAGLGAAALLAWVLAGVRRGEGEQGRRGASEPDAAMRRPCDAANAEPGLPNHELVRTTENHPFSPSPLLPLFVRYAAAALLIIWCAGLCWWGAGRYTDEENIASTIVRYDPDSVWARYNLTSTLANQGKRRQAIPQLEALLDNLFGSSAWRSADTVEQVIRSNPTMLARIHEEQGTTIKPKEWLCDVYVRLGYLRLDTGDIPGAMTAFRIGEKMNPKDGETAAGQGECYFVMHDYPAAARELEYAIRIEPGLVRAMAKLTKTYLVLGRWREAADTCRRVLRIIPWSPGAYKDLAEAQLKMGDVDGAVTTLETSLRKGPVRDDVRQMLAQLQRQRAHRTTPTSPAV